LYQKTGSGSYGFVLVTFFSTDIHQITSKLSVTHSKQHKYLTSVVQYCLQHPCSSREWGDHCHCVCCLKWNPRPGSSSLEAGLDQDL